MNRKIINKCVLPVGICEIRQQIQIHVNINLKEMKHLYLNFKIYNQDLIKKKKGFKTHITASYKSIIFIDQNYP